MSNPSLWSRLVSAIERRTSPENPTTNLANPASWLTNAWGGVPSVSGLTINERTAMSYAAAFACINVGSKDLAQIPAKTYQRVGDEREEARDHSMWRVMHDRPNEWMTPFTFKQTLHAHAMAWGNGFAEIELDGAGRVLNLWPLLPDRTKCVIVNGRKFIDTKVSDGGGQWHWARLPYERVLHIPGLGFDGLTGYSVIGMARNAIGTAMAAEEFGGRFFSNGATPRYALLHPKTLSQPAKDRLRLDFEAANTGLSNAHRTAVFEEGLTIEKIGLPASDAEMIETSKFGIEQMARFFDIPLMRLHSTTAITSWGTGLEQWQLAYLTHFLGPWLVQWEESINWSCFTEEDRKTYYVEFLREALLQADFAARGEFYTKLFNIGTLSPNQIAKKENLPSFGAAGDQRFVQGAMVPIDKIGAIADANIKKASEPTPVPPAVPPKRALPTPRLHDACYRLYRQAAERVVTKYVQRARAKLKKDVDVEEFRAWVREFSDGERSAVQIAFLPATMALADMAGCDAALLQTHADAISRRITATLVDDILAKPDHASLVATLSAWEAKSADALAMHETHIVLSLITPQEIAA